MTINKHLTAGRSVLRPSTACNAYSYGNTPEEARERARGYAFTCFIVLNFANDIALNACYTIRANTRIYKQETKRRTNELLKYVQDYNSHVGVLYRKAGALPNGCDISERVAEEYDDTVEELTKRVGNDAEIFRNMIEQDFAKVSPAHFELSKLVVANTAADVVRSLYEKLGDVVHGGEMYRYAEHSERAELMRAKIGFVIDAIGGTGAMRTPLSQGTKDAMVLFVKRITDFFFTKDGRREDC